MTDSILKLIKSNRPSILIEENDFLGTIPKGKMIKDFIEKISENKEIAIQIIAIFGEWGSGKSSLMHWIKNNLNENKFYPILFEAWEHENDDNLALSLIDTIIANKPSKYHELKRDIFRFLRCVTKSVIIEVPGFKINPKEGIQEAQNIDNEKSFQERLGEFKKSFKELEDDILGIDSNKKLIVFIDDLDRCEPENVLALLSVIKLFFTYGKRTIFIFGVDKKAISEAVGHKYKDVIKADEYMEKIFDISFSMPKEIYPIKLLETYLIKEEYRYENNIEGKEEEYMNLQLVSEFFTTIKFGNSRHLRKVLNKYIFIKYLKQEKIDDNLIPDLNKPFYIILTLFIIILYEFHFDKYNIIKDYEKKLIHYASVMNPSKEENINDIKHYMFNNIETTIKKMKITKKIPINKNINYSTSEEKVNFEIFRYSFITIFAPLTQSYVLLNYSAPISYINQFIKEDNILSDFCIFIEKNINCVLDCDDEYFLTNIFEMAELYL